MKKLLILAAAFVALALTPQMSNAEPSDPIIQGSFDVNVEGNGKVTGTSINCPGDCAADAAWRESELPPVNRLTAVETVAGWAFNGWSDCASVNGQPKKCDAGYGEVGAITVTARFTDVMAPSVYLNSISPSFEEVGNDVWVSAVTSDNDRVTKVEYLVDGSVKATATVSPWNAHIDTSGLTEGAHQLRLRSYDPTGNVGISNDYEITIDHTAPSISLTDPVAATPAAAPAFNFTSASPDYSSADCAIRKVGQVVDIDQWCGLDEAFSAEVEDEGDYEFVVRAYDNAGNETTVVHPFVVDRTAPELTITSGPADGDTIAKGDVKYGWTVNDRTDVTQACAWDDAAPAACDLTTSKSVAKGDHTFRLEATDQAGNKSSVSRTVKVLGDGTGPDDKPDDKPDDPKPGKDTTAPVIKLASAEQKLKALKKGLKVKVTCSEACAGTVKAKAVGGFKFTGRANLASAGTTRTVLKPTTKTRKKLKKTTGMLRLTVTTRLADPSGNAADFSLRTLVRK